MESLLIGLVVLIAVLFLIALFGHMLWLMGAAIWNGIFGPPVPPPPANRPRRRRTCPACGYTLLPTDRDCYRCGLEQDSRLAAQVERIRSAEREVNALAERGELDPETAGQVAARLDARVRNLTRRPAAVPEATPLPRAVPVTAHDRPPEPAASEPQPFRAPEPRRHLEAPPEPPAAPAPATPPAGPPRRSVLAAFMEEKNILWGELVGGLLIVGCSIALVLTLWRSLEALPYFSFGLPAIITGALFFAGWYTLHHWKLASTSRGLLVISLLLAPLNLLLLANPGTDTAGGWLDVGVKLAAVLIFVGMVRAAGRDLIGTHLLPGPVDRRWLLSLAVVGAPASQALPAAWTTGELGFVAAWLPLACHAIACGAVLGGLTWYRRREEHQLLDDRQASAVLMFVGMSLFALFAAWGFLLIRSPDLPVTLRSLALPLVIASVPVLEAGLLVQRRLVAGHTHLKATGTGVALAGSALLMGGVVLAWPDPLRLTLVSLVAGVVFTRIAWREALPWFHAGAVPALGLVCVLAVHGIAGRWSAPEGTPADHWLASLLGTSTSGVVLAGFALVLAAVGELAVRRGNRPQGIGYALGAVAAGIFGLLLVSVHGAEEPWPAVGAHIACAVGLLAANVRWKKRTAAQAGVWLVLVATVWLLWAAAPGGRGWWGFGIALEALALAVVALALTPRAAQPGRAGVVFGQFRIACRDVSAAAGLLAVAFALFSPGFPEGHLHTGTLLALAPTGLLLARVFAKPGFTWAGSAALLLGLTHLTVYTVGMRPVTAALLLALLAHATTALLLARAFRGKRSRERLFADPFRQSARIASGIAVLFLVFPASGFALGWAGFALWLAALWFVMVWVWREPGGFSAAQGALAAAAVLVGLAWVEKQEWWGSTGMGAGDPRALQAFGLGLGALGLGWVAARRALRGNERLRALWLCDPFAIDRLILGGVIVGQLLLLALAIEPAVRAEQVPAGRPFWDSAPAELAHAFGAGGWLLLGVLTVTLVASLRWRTDEEPESDPTLIGLAVLGLSVPVLGAGSFAPELAAASALRWGLAVVFLLGSAVLFFRQPLGRLVANTGFLLRTSTLASRWGYALFAVAAGVAVLLTMNVAQIGLSGQRPAGPAEGSIFAWLGWTVSNVVPMAIVVLGLAATAARERSAGYAFAAGLVFAGTVTGGYALAVVTGGGSLDAVQQVRLGMLAAGSFAAWALLWLSTARRVPGGPLLTAQVVFGLAGVGLLTLVALVRVIADPGEPLDPALGEFGRFGWLVQALAAWAGFEHASRSAPHARAHVVGFTGVVVGVLAACTVGPLDEPERWLSFHMLAAVWAVVGLALTTILFRLPAVSRGLWLNVLAVGLVVLALRGPAPEVGRWLAPVALAGYALLAAALVPPVRFRSEVSRDRWAWLVQAEGIVAAVALLLGVIAAVAGPILERLAGPLAVLLLAAAALLLAARSPAEWVSRLRLSTVLLGAVGLGLLGWAVPNPDVAAVWLQRNGWAFVGIVASAVACLELVPRLLPGSGWATTSRRVGGGLAGAAVVWLAVVLLQQIPAFDPATRRTPLELPAVLAILGGIAVLIVLAFRFALRPAADPLGLPEAKRTSYVYLAEVLLVLFFVHIRFNLPELFLGQAVRYWTFIVMALAFVGVGLAEVCERRRVSVLAIPFRRTGVLLPLVPLLTFWAKPPGALLDFADNSAPGMHPLLGYLYGLPQEFDRYAWLWFLAGTLYGMVALSRRSFGWALVAALAANAGFWALLTHNGISAAVHPQIWVIPLALIILVSEHINRRELRPDVSAGLRYLGIGMLYLSSAADMFIAGAGESIWLPVILAVLCVIGIFAGIMLRVRAFLFLGAGFLVLDIFAMIWHAAVDREQTWVWYVSGIVLGAAILALFAVFEKRRNDVLGVVERLRRWD